MKYKDYKIFLCETCDGKTRYRRQRKGFPDVWSFETFESEKEARQYIINQNYGTTKKQTERK